MTHAEFKYFLLYLPCSDLSSLRILHCLHELKALFFLFYILPLIIIITSYIIDLNGNGFRRMVFELLLFKDGRCVSILSYID